MNLMGVSRLEIGWAFVLAAMCCALLAHTESGWLMWLDYVLAAWWAAAWIRFLIYGTDYRP